MKIDSLAGVLVLIAFASTAFADTTLTTSVDLSIPKKPTDKRIKPPFDRTEFDLWLPGDVDVIRGVIVNPFYRKAVTQKHWQAAARHWKFGIVGTDFFGIKSQDHPTLATALKQFATEARRPELKHAPFFFVGMSAGAGMSTKLAALYPNRTIAVAPVCLEVGPRTPESREIPMITVFGERDGRQMEKLLDKLPIERAENARWAIAVQWRKRHEFGRANNLVMPFFDRVLATRYPAELSPADGPVKLKSFPADAGWLGDVNTWGESPAMIMAADSGSSVSPNCWFPDRYTATVWQSFVTASPRLKITSPPAVDMKPFATLSAGKPVTVQVRPVGDARFAQIVLLNGDSILAASDALPADFTIKLNAGIHTLIARETDGTGQVRLSLPSTVIVK